MPDRLAIAHAGAQQWLAAHQANLTSDPAVAVAAARITNPAELAPGVGRLAGAYNHCATCGLVTKDAKYCPYCGPELQHVTNVLKCLACNEQVTFDKSTYCGWCGKPLAPAESAT